MSDDVIDDELALASGRKTALLVIKQQCSVMDREKKVKERERDHLGGWGSVTQGVRVHYTRVAAHSGG